MDDNITPEPILQLGLAFWGSKTLLSAVEIGLFTHLAAGSLDAKSLAAALDLHPRGVNDFLDALVALGMLERVSGEYRNAPAADVFLDRNKPSYVGGLLEMANARLYPFWASLTEALRTGHPQNEAKVGENFFTALYEDPDRLEQFLHAMTGISMGDAHVIAETFPWER
jgi:methyltransferase family protein